MSEPTTERLYNLLPAIYRIRDVERGEPLRALLGVFEGELTALHDDIEALYDDWFIETCAEWVVPYIGDLVGVRGLLPTSGQAFSQRGRVANALAQRRGKGTGASLEQLARDVTGWPTHVLEFFQLLASTQQVNHVRRDSPATVDLRNTDQLERLGGAFEVTAHTAEVRRVANARGKYDIPNLGIFLWRLPAYSLQGVTAREATAATPQQRGRFRFSPLAIDAPLFNAPRTNLSGTEAGVPAPLRRRALFDDLAGPSRGRVYFGIDPVLQVRVQLDAAGPLTTVAPDAIAICDLSDADIPEVWRRPSGEVRVAIDPALGRLALSAGVVAARVEVDHAYGFSGDLGGGPYNRRDAIGAWLGGGPDASFRVDVGTTSTALADAIAQWNAQPTGTSGVITFVDSRTYATAIDIVVPAESRLLLVAGNRQRPHLLGNVTVRGTAAADALTPGGLCLNGLLIEGNVVVGEGNLGELRISHSTLVPLAGLGGLSAESNAALDVTVERSIVGPIRVAETVRALRLVDSIVDGSLAGAAAVSAPATGVDASTIVGTTFVDRLDASNSIFTAEVGVQRRQTGCVRFSFVPPGSLAPRRFHCQPDDGDDVVRIAPRFTSLSYGQPGYAQLASACPPEISAGADDEGEMGAFHFLQQTQRLRSLQASLDEHVRFGLEAGLFLVT
jgi:hypothetical protein